MQEALSPGSQVGRYRIEQVVARGGMGVVYRAFDLGLERNVALKVIAPEIASEPGFRERFIRESRLAAGIDHPNVIPVFEAGEDGGTLFLAMRFVDGRDLRELIALDGRLDAARAVDVVAQVAAALDAAHARGLVHRDVKPANVLITSDGHAYLTDFGIAKREEATGLTQTGQMVGTIDYAAPEQIAGEAVDARTDVYALGCLLYAALAGDVPFRRSSAAAAMMAHLRDAPPPLEGVPPELGTVVGRALAKRAEDRYGSAGEFARAAKEAATGVVPASGAAAPVAPPGGGPTEVTPTDPPTPPPPTAPLPHASGPPGGATPGGATPAGATPAGATPAGAAPAGATPGGATPGGATPAGATPGGATPAGATPAGATPAGATHTAPTAGGTGPTGPPPPAPPTAPLGAPPAAPRGRRRWPLVVGLLAVLAVGVIVAVALFSSGDGGGQRVSSLTVPTVTVPTATSPTTTAPPAVGEPVSRAEASDVVQRYIAAYEAEDTNALGELFAPDIVQRSESTGSENRGKEAVVNDFALQFQVADDPEYTFTPKTFAERPAPSRLIGDYSVSTSLGGPSGEIEFGIENVDGAPLISEIITRSG